MPKAHDIPVIDCSAGQRKHDLAEEYLAKTTVTQGLFLVLIGRAQAPVWDVSGKQPSPRSACCLGEPKWSKSPPAEVSGECRDLPNNSRARAASATTEAFRAMKAGEVARAVLTFD
jgi:hypothetical protein